LSRIDDEGIEMLGAGAATRWEWDRLIGWSETENLFLVRQVDPGAIILPKRALPSAGEEEALRAMLRTRAIPRTGGFPVQR
jgi:hypothetical protein